MPHTITRKIDIYPDFADFDLMGIVNNCVYFRWFERGRLDMTSNILSIQEALDHKIALAVSENECTYEIPVIVSDQLQLITKLKIEDYFPAKLKFFHQIINKKTKQTHAISTCSCALFDIEKKILIQSAPKFLIEKYLSL